MQLKAIYKLINTRKRQKIHSYKPTTSTQSPHLQELVSSHLTKIPFDHVILEDGQSFAANLMWASPTQTEFQEIHYFIVSNWAK